MTYEEPPGPPRRGLTGARPPWVLALVLAFVQVVGSSIAGRHQSHRVDLDALGYLLLLAGPAMLLLRRSRPVAVVAGTAAVTVLYTVLGYPYGPVFASMVVAFFSAVASGHRKAVLTSRRWPSPGTRWSGPGSTAGCRPPATTASPGRRCRASAPGCSRCSPRPSSSGSAASRSPATGGERAEAARRRADEERLRIARELHDVLAHSISVINVQAGVALALIDERPEQARTALTTIKAASKEALGEVRQVLGALRAPGEAPRSPAPGLDRLPELLEQATSAGLTADVTVEGTRAPLPPGIDLAAFRIIQEALTNIVRHSGSRAARIRLSYAPGRVSVLVDDDGPAVAGGDSGGGNGLVGMRERAAALGGSVRPARAPTAASASGRAAAHRTGPPRPAARTARPARPSAEQPDQRDRRRGAPMIRVLLADDQMPGQSGLPGAARRAERHRGGRRGGGRRAGAAPGARTDPGRGADGHPHAADGRPRRHPQDHRGPGAGKVKVVILTTFELDEYVFEAIRAGASGFLVKDTEPEELLRAVRAVVDGDALLSPGVTRRLIAEFAARSKEPAVAAGLDQLTDREREVMALVGIGLSNEEIARRLVVSPLTAKTHVSRAMVKLAARDRAQLVVLAYESGLVRPGWLG